MRNIHVLLLLCVVIAAIGSCTKNDSPESSATRLQEETILPVEVQTVQRTEWVNDVSTYGTVKAPDKIDIFSKMSGKLIRLLVKEEQRVRIDDVVAIVERDEVGATFKPVAVKATTDGKVETLYLKTGAKVSDVAPILSITKHEALKLVVSPFETDVAKLGMGQKAVITMDALPGREFTGKVSLIKPYLDAHSGKGEVEITFDRNYPEIIPGMFGRARIIIDRRTTLTIVPDALKRINGNRAVYVVKDGIAKLTFVELGLQKPDAVEITKGISAGDIVIIFASEELKDGTRVKLVEGTQQ